MFFCGYQISEFLNYILVKDLIDRLRALKNWISSTKASSTLEGFDLWDDLAKHVIDNNLSDDLAIVEAQDDILKDEITFVAGVDKSEKIIAFEPALIKYQLLPLPLTW